MRHSKKKHFPKVTSALLAVTMTVSAAPAVLAAETTSSASALAATASSGVSPVFSDVTLGHWAEKHIHKLAALGILQGNNGKFRPSDAITQQEAIALAIRYMGLESEVVSDPAVALPDEIQVGNYFKGYIVLALQKGLIDLEEETMAAGSTTTWGETQASREWVTKILVRAVGKEGEAQSVMNMPTSFSDNEDISTDALGYVNTAVELGLTTGMDENRFVPKGTVTRAQIATFFSRGDDMIGNVNYTNERYGILAGMTDSQLRIYSEDNTWETSQIDSTTMWYKKDSEQSISPTDVPLYTRVRLIGQSGVASYVELVDDEQHVETVEATLIYPVTSLNKLHVKFAGQADLEEITYTSDTVFKDVSGNTIQATDLEDNSELAVVRETFSEQKSVLQIELKSGPVNKTGNGTIASVDTEGRQVTVLNEDGVNETFAVAEDVSIRYQDKYVDFEDLKATEAISYTVKNSIITAITLTQAPEMEIEGKLLEIGNSKTLVTILNSDNKPEAKLLASQVDIKINGITNPTLDDLVTGDYGDTVRLTVSSDDKVTKIEVTSRELETLIGASVISYDEETKLLTVQDDNDRPYVFYLNDGTEYELNGSTVIEQVVISMLDGSRKVNIQYTDKQVRLIQFVYKYEGTVVHASTTSSTITIKLANDQMITVPYESSLLPIDKFGETSLTVKSLNTGDYIIATLSSDQSTIISVAVRSTNQFEVADLNTSTNRISLLDTDSNVTEHSASSVPVYGLDNELITLASLSVNDVVNAVFDGSTLIELRKVAVSMGIVQSVDLTNGIVVVKDYNGELQTFESADGLTVVTSTSSSSGLNSLEEGDRVESRQDANGQMVLKVTTATEKTFWKYDSINNEIYVNRAVDDTSQNNFKIHSDAIIRNAAGETITLDSLVNSDKIELYFFQDQIIELVKN